MFEKLFFRMDEDHSGSISVDEAALFLSFVALDLDVEERMAAFGRADIVKDGSLTRLEFCELCRAELWDMPLSSINVAVDNMITARVAIKNRMANNWKKIADIVDVRARSILPALYLCTMVVLFNLDFRDAYDDPRVVMRTPPAALKNREPRAVPLACTVLRPL